MKPGDELSTQTSRYRILDKLGESGLLGDVFLVADVNAEKARYACKVLRPQRNPLQIKSFLSEANTLAVINKAEDEKGAQSKTSSRVHAVRLIDCSWSVDAPPDPESPEMLAGGAFLVLELVEGRNFADDWLALDHRVPLELSMAAAVQFAQLLAIGHEVGILYTDMKTENLYWQGGWLRVIDWNVTGRIAEQGEAGIREDWRRFGAVLYHLLTGRQLNFEKLGSMTSTLGMAASWRQLPAGLRLFIEDALQGRYSQPNEPPFLLEQYRMMNAESETLLSEGRDAYEQGDSVKALSAFSWLLQRKSNMFSDDVDLALVRRLQEEIQEQRRYGKQALFKAGRALLERMVFDKARGYFLNALAQESQASARIRRYLWVAELGESDKAFYAHNAEALEAALNALDQERPEQAIQYISGLLAVQPDNSKLQWLAWDAAVERSRADVEEAMAAEDYSMAKVALNVACSNLARLIKHSSQEGRASLQLDLDQFTTRLGQIKDIEQWLDNVRQDLDMVEQLNEAGKLANQRSKYDEAAAYHEQSLQLLSHCQIGSVPSKDLRRRGRDLQKQAQNAYRTVTQEVELQRSENQVHEWLLLGSTSALEAAMHLCRSLAAGDYTRYGALLRQTEELYQARLRDQNEAKAREEARRLALKAATLRDMQSLAEARLLYEQAAALAPGSNYGEIASQIARQLQDLEMQKAALKKKLPQLRANLRNALHVAGNHRNRGSLLAMRDALYEAVTRVEAEYLGTLEDFPEFEQELQQARVELIQADKLLQDSLQLLATWRQQVAEGNSQGAISSRRRLALMWEREGTDTRLTEAADLHPDLNALDPELAHLERQYRSLLRNSEAQRRKQAQEQAWREALDAAQRAWNLHHYDDAIALVHRVTDEIEGSSPGRDARLEELLYSAKELKSRYRAIEVTRQADELIYSDTENAYDEAMRLYDEALALEPLPLAREGKALLSQTLSDWRQQILGALQREDDVAARAMFRRISALSQNSTQDGILISLLEEAFANRFRQVRAICNEQHNIALARHELSLLRQHYPDRLPQLDSLEREIEQFKSANELASIRNLVSLGTTDSLSSAFNLLNEFTEQYWWPDTQYKGRNLPQGATELWSRVLEGLAQFWSGRARREIEHSKDPSASSELLEAFDRLGFLQQVESKLEQVRVLPTGTQLVAPVLSTLRAEWQSKQEQHSTRIFIEQRHREIEEALKAGRALRALQLANELGSHAEQGAPGLGQELRDIVTRQQTIKLAREGVLPGGPAPHSAIIYYARLQALRTLEQSAQIPRNHPGNPASISADLELLRTLLSAPGSEQEQLEADWHQAGANLLKHFEEARAAKPTDLVAMRHFSERLRPPSGLADVAVSASDRCRYDYVRALVGVYEHVGSLRTGLQDNPASFAEVAADLVELQRTAYFSDIPGHIPALSGGQTVPINSLPPVRALAEELNRSLREAAHNTPELIAIDLYLRAFELVPAAEQFEQMRLLLENIRDRLNSSPQGNQIALDTSLIVTRLAEEVATLENKQNWVLGQKTELSELKRIAESLARFFHLLEAMESYGARNLSWALLFPLANWVEGKLYTSWAALVDGDGKQLKSTEWYEVAASLYHIRTHSGQRSQADYQPPAVPSQEEIKSLLAKQDIPKQESPEQAAPPKDTQGVLRKLVAYCASVGTSACYAELFPSRRSWLQRQGEWLRKALEGSKQRLLNTGPLRNGFLILLLVVVSGFSLWRVSLTIGDIDVLRTPPPAATITVTVTPNTGAVDPQPSATISTDDNDSNEDNNSGISEDPIPRRPRIPEE